MDNNLKEKIQKCLEMARRGGTEAEMETAMRMVQAMLAKYNLSMAQVEESEVQDEEYILDNAEETADKALWKGHVWQGLARLYFCQHWTAQGIKDGKVILRHIIAGKPSNVAVVKNFVPYIIRLGESLAKNAGQGSVYRNSFKKGFGSRIYVRCQEEINAAMRGEVKDESTGKALVLSALYPQIRRELDGFLREHGIHLTSKSSKSHIRNGDAYRNGSSAANGVALRSKGIESGGSVKLIGR